MLPDLTTLLGLGGAFGVLAVAMAAGSALDAFLDGASLLLVLGGTAAVTVISFSPSDLGQAMRGCLATLTVRARNPRAVARTLIAVAAAARRDDPDSLRAVAADVGDLPLFRRGLVLLADGVPADGLDRMLTAEMEAAAQTAERTAMILRRSAEVAPAMGLIGTLIGLVQMLGQLQDPAAIGPAMAVALLTTFYGAVIGNMILHPVAGKIESNAEADLAVQRLCIVGAVSIARQEGIRRLELLLNAALPPDERVRQSPEPGLR